MFRLRRRRSSEDIREKAAARGGAPSYRRDDGAVEYGTGKDRPKSEPRQDDLSASDGKAGDARFHPLPRCPICRTAIGFEQNECHSCGRELKKV